MDERVATLEQIRLNGLTALARELGPTGMIRFLQQFETGHGDYSVERHRWLDQTDVQTLAKRIQSHREQP